MSGDATFGSLRLARELAPTRLGFGRTARRWIGLDEVTSTVRTVYAIPLARVGFARRRFIEAAVDAAGVRGDHILPIEAFSLDARRGGIVVTPFIGDADGLLSLGALVKGRGGSLAGSEVARAVAQLLQALEPLHRAGLCDGALGEDRILIDPRGKVRLELPGMAYLLARRPIDPVEGRREDTRRIASLAAACIRSDPVSPGVREWLTLAASPLDGFADASAALASFRDRAGVPVPGPEPAPSPAVGVVRGLMHRIFGRPASR